jgi:hypothetical protein
VGRTVKGGPPSSVAKAPAFKKEQQENHLLNGRPDGTREGLPVGLYSPVFDNFSAALKTEPDEFDLRNTIHRTISTLCTHAVDIYGTEEGRWNVIKPLLQVILGAPIEHKKTATGAASDGVICSQVAGRQVFRAIFEIKNEIGTGGCDPSVQGAFSYRNYYSQRPVCDLQSVVFFRN